MKILATVFLLVSCTHLWAQNSVNILVSLSPAGSFNAVTDKVKGRLEKNQTGFSSKRIELNIRSLKTGIELRDQHFWEHLNYKTNSKATLSELKAQANTGSAMLEVNGVKIPVTISYQDKGGHVDANFKVKASDFKLSPKSYLGVGVNDEVTINVKMDYK